MKRAQLRRAMKEFIKPHWRRIRNMYNVKKKTKLVDRVKFVEHVRGVKLQRREDEAKANSQ